MATSQDIDSLFHRAVDIVQSLPKGGPVQTSYEEKLWLYSLYKQGTEGDISIPRPGILDILGKAKWDSWNKQKGINKVEAKRLYVNALLKILKKHGELESVKSHLSELEAFGSTSVPRLPTAGTDLARPASPASSTSSYHSSQASPPPTIPLPPTYNMLPPDPSLPPPDVAEDIVPPSALTSSHRSLLSLSQAHKSPEVGPSYGYPPNVPSVGASASGVSPAGVGHVASRAHSLIGGRGGSSSVQGDFRHSGRDSVHSFRQRPYFEPSQHQYPRGGTAAGVGMRSESPQMPAVRDFGGPGLSAGLGLGNPQTPDPHLSPYLGYNAPTPIYPPRPGSTSTYSHVPPQPLNVANTLQSIQTSLVALHERLSVLERTQAMILRKDERKRNWFWTSREDEELDEIEDETQRNRTRSAQSAGGTNTITKLRRKKGRLSIRVIWYMLTALRRALVDVGVGMMVLLVGIIVLGGGWRRARFTLGRLRTRLQRYLTD
ncbi:hypothetical protein IAU59_003750 [Kwoniella sp. CBS 9459]